MPDVRLIDANALDKELVQEYIMYNDANTVLTLNGIQVFNAAIDTARSKIGESPTIDAVEVVRCRECRNSQKLKTCADQVYCMVWKSNPRTDGYCYLGAKMDGGAAG